jgi:electron transport complex protein RnfC
MHKFKTFARGGVHPQDKKSLSKENSIKRMPIPGELIIAMGQHLGAPAKAMKVKGDRVAMGEKIGTACAFISAEIHCPVDGVVTDVRRVTLANSVTCDALVVQPDESQDYDKYKRVDYSSMDSQALLDKIKDYGIVGLGGATFPTHVKLSIPKGRKVDTLVINAVECEPYLTSDYRLLLERAEDVLEGTMIIAKTIRPDNIIIGVEANKLDAADALEAAISRLSYPITVQRLKVKYPQGDEKQLLKATIGKEIPSGKLPLDIGAVVCNTGTALAVFEAIAMDKPLFERVVTVSGENVNNPSNILAPIGTKTSDLIAFAGGLVKDSDKLICGGPMMGFAFYDEETPMTKGTSGILAIDDTPRVQTACVSCGKCVAHCPMGLEPTKLYKYITTGNYDLAMKANLMDCKECGCCAYSCMASLPLVQAFKYGKVMARRK